MKVLNLRRSIANKVTVLAVVGVSFNAPVTLFSATSPVPLLEMGVDGRGVALGEAVSATAEDASALYWNPAALTQMSRDSFTLMHASHLDAAQLNYGAYGHNGGRGAFGLAFQHLAVSGLDRLDENGTELGSFSPQDNAAALGYSYRWDRISFGLSGKYVQSKIVESADTLAGDFGAIYRLGHRDTFRLAVVAANLGGRLNYGSTEEKISNLYKIGAALDISPRWNIAVEGGLPSRGDATIHAGNEFWLMKSPSWALALRAGFNSRKAQSAGTGGVSAGMGIGIGTFRFDYAASLYGELGLQHLASIALRFGEAKWEAPPIKPAKPKKASPPPEVEKAQPVEMPKIDFPTRNYIPFEPDRTDFHQKSQRVYQVRKGDTYQSISQMFYGKKELWRQIYLANQHLSKGTKPVPGQRIVIPPLR